jgi:UDP-N-acetylmuramate: L-alanyl-gamma-D-glutamyl-meso-diaminopimelate ligase
MPAKHAHLIGICGTAMASLAGMLKQTGMTVTGSDAAAYPPMSDFLERLGIKIMQPFSEKNLSPRPDFVVVGNAISRGNPELEAVLDARILMRSLPQILQEQFLTARESIVVAGTHGKTTTTSMLAWILDVAGLKPSFLIGGIAENFGSSFAVNEGKHFVVEGDEYDTAFFDKGPKFLHYMPQSLLLTHVEFDHADIYSDLASVKTAFKRLVNLVPRSGKIIAFDGSENVRECVAKAFSPVELYGFSADAFWRIERMELAPKVTRWRVIRQGRPWAKFEFPLAGDYNVLNATAAAAMAFNLGAPVVAIDDAVRTFKSVKRRLEVIAEIEGITIIDDFAHHPTAIAATLNAVKTRYPGRRIWAIFEPRSNTLRRKVFERELIASLSHADEVVVASVFRPEAIPQAERLEPQAIVEGLEQHQKKASLLTDADEIVHVITRKLQTEDVVVILSNGGFGGIYEKLPQALKSRMRVLA